MEDYSNKGMSVTTKLVGNVKASLANCELIDDDKLARRGLPRAA